MKSQFLLVTFLSSAACATVSPLETHTLHTKGTISVGGLEGSFEDFEDLPTGRWLSRYTLGPTSGAEGYDGELSWEMTSSGEVIVGDGQDTVTRTKTRAFLVRRGYLRNEPAESSPERTEVHEGKTYTVRELTPPGGTPIELWFDEKKLLARTKHQRGRDTIWQTFEDHRNIGGVMVPHKFISDSGEPRNLLTLITTEAELLPAFSPDKFARPATDARVVFEGGVKQTELPMELINNHIYLRAEIDGKEVRLLMDTGGANLVTPKAAQRLGLESSGKMGARGAGEETVDIGVSKAKMLVLGAVKVADPVFYVLDLTEVENAEGINFDGLVGFEVFHRFVVRIDYPARKVVLIDPKHFTPPAVAQIVPFELDEATPVIAGEIDGIPARMTIDTGSRSAISAHSPFAKEHNLAKKYGARFETVNGWGVGGASRSWPVRMKKVKMGEVVVENVAGDLYLGEKGAFADPKYSANIGGEILGLFVVTFDYEGRKMYLQPGPPNPLAERYDRSGMWLQRAGEKLELAAVVPQGPAERAGLKAGDQLTAIAGQPVTARPLAEWRIFLRTTAPGTKIAVTYFRDGQTRNTELILEELLP